MTTHRTEDEDSFLYGMNAPFIEELYQAYRENPKAVPADWQDFFQNLTPNIDQEVDDRPPQWSKRRENGLSQPVETGRSESTPSVTQGMLDSLRALMMIRAYRVRGHLIADLDPLGLEKRANHPELDPLTYNFGPDDYDRPIFINYVLGLEWATLRQILEQLRSTYCGTVGVEFMHIQDPDQKAWIQQRIENTKPDNRVTDPERQRILRNLIHADSFERFLHVKFTGEKRFGLEGGESLIPALETVLIHAAHQNVHHITFGMAHRGRLSVLANILNKPLRAIFAKFQHDQTPPELQYGSGDVKYHIGFSGDREIEGQSMHLSLASNPSHLEAVNPVVLGKVRAQQFRLGDEGRNQAMALLIHGDAAFAGQGLTAETLELSGLEGYQTGGTIHIIINNQIGFTTSPPHSRSSPYSSDIAKAIQVPIFHVNGDNPEAVVWIAQLAAEFRHHFEQDVVIDMVCYRRHGHNEIDEPSFTQPKMYKAIGNHPSTCQIYRQKMVNKGLTTEEELQSIAEQYENLLRQEYDIALENKTGTLAKIDWLEGSWAGIKPPDHLEDEDDFEIPTGFPFRALQQIGLNIFHIPDHFKIHPRIARQLETKRQLAETGNDIDWTTGEALAIGSLLLESNPVRLSGQDCGRGTFSQRHAIWIDQETEHKYIPLNHLTRDQKTFFQIVDSPLAEASVLGFEYGYSLSSPHSLVMWEAQFGDFANGAQVIIDQFISSGELKWLRLSGIVLLLPHGYEGQGPEHTSARLERFLQLCAESNMRVANCSTPANFFHILRRQVRTDIRKPLVVVTPKSLLRHPQVVSSFKEMDIGTHFLPVIPDAMLGVSDIQRVILCSGKVYYDLFQERERRQLRGIALVRLEQFYPFPRKHLLEVLKPYKSAQFVWCQEEPMNMGAWTFLDRRLESVLIELGAHQTRPVYIGRAPSASPATGVLSRHLAEQQALIDQALLIQKPEAQGLFAV